MSPLLNYSTKVSAIKTAGEITGVLVSHRARAILTEYGSDNEVTALAFKVNTPHGEVAIRLPIDADAVQKVLKKQRVAPRFLDREQAVRIAWRIVKDWVEAQMAILETEMVTLDQIFLPYIVMKDGRTVYQRLLDTHFQLPEGRKEDDMP